MPSNSQLASEWRQEQGFNGRGGVVIVFQGEVQGWVNELRDPEHWLSGCVAIDEAGQQWQTIAGSENAGAFMWLPLGDPDKSEKKS
ncbi:hypothetical protein [Aeromonas veronii]|uniref:Uncharacterized protein n=1 Tax=Aeromonas veronii TaxID=654 RepID=A0A4S5CK72_AERVE|nr:hypothetical protein [Aeromonas veronii]THJ45013.1 hypothetical protein E8Q35_12555 [Aeromonas veronii]